MSDEEKDNSVTSKVVGPLLYKGVVVGLMVMAGFVTITLKVLAKLWGVDKDEESGRSVHREEQKEQVEDVEEEWEEDSFAE